MINLLKKITIKKSLIFIVLIFILFEIINISTDIYNFKQLEKVKIILNDLKRENKQFLNLREFNEIYNVDIKPIKNCYYLRNYNSDDKEPYTIWFRLESLTYKIKYMKNYLIYPRYNLKEGTICIMWGGCNDMNFIFFIETISIKE